MQPEAWKEYIAQCWLNNSRKALKGALAAVSWSKYCWKWRLTPYNQSNFILFLYLWYHFLFYVLTQLFCRYLLSTSLSFFGTPNPPKESKSITSKHYPWTIRILVVSVYPYVHNLLIGNNNRCKKSELQNSYFTILKQLTYRQEPKI